MGKRRRQRDSSRRADAAPNARQARAATPAIEAKRPVRFEDQLTVFWMMTTLFTLATMALDLGATAYDALRDSPTGDGASLAVADYARLATAMTSLLLLVMTPIVLNVRQVAPPRAVTIFVLAVAIVGLGWALLTGATAQDFFGADRSSDPAGGPSIATCHVLLQAPLAPPVAPECRIASSSNFDDRPSFGTGGASGTGTSSINLTFKDRRTASVRSIRA